MVGHPFVFRRNLKQVLLEDAYHCAGHPNDSVYRGMESVQMHLVIHRHKYMDELRTRKKLVRIGNQRGHRTIFTPDQ